MPIQFVTAGDVHNPDEMQPDDVEMAPSGSGGTYSTGVGQPLDLKGADNSFGSDDECSSINDG